MRQWNTRRLHKEGRGVLLRTVISVNLRPLDKIVDGLPCYRENNYIDHKEQDTNNGENTNALGT